MSIENLDDYILEFQKYKEGKYKFGNYQTEDQIFYEFLKGKIFVLKGGFSIGDWIWMIIICTIISVSLFALLFSNIGIFILPLIFTIPFSPFFLLQLRHFVVIGPLGVYYQKMTKKGFFSWNNVNNIKHFTQTTRGFTIGVVVKIYISQGRKIRFGSSMYLNKEFPRKVKREMFFNLFYIYFKLSQDKIIQSSIKEYEKLLERKNKDEYVDDLIKQNRYTAKMKNTLLIVRSKPKILDLTVKFLKLGEFDTITCSNAKEALKVIEERYNDIAMILLDPMMPRLNREKFLQSVKSDKRYKHILVKFLPKDFTSDHI